MSLPLMYNVPAVQPLWWDPSGSQQRGTDILTSALISHSEFSNMHFPQPLLTQILQP